MSQSGVSEELFNTDDLNTDGILESNVENSHVESEIIENTEEQIIEDLENQIEDPQENEDEQMEATDENDIEDTEGADELETEGTEATEGTETTKPKKSDKPTQDRLTNLPIAKIKHIIKLDPDVKLVNAEAVFLITKTTELFIKSLAKESFGYAAQNKKKTIAKNHVESALTMLPVEL